MKKITSNTILAGLLLISAGANAQNYNGKILGMSGAGVASAEFSSGGILNPALVANFSEKDSFNINFNGGALISDEDNFIDSADSIVNTIFDISTSQDAQAVIPGFETLRTELLAFDDSTLRANASGSLQVTIPNDFLPASIFITTGLALGATSLIAESDIDYLDSIIDGTVSSNSNFNGGDLLSGVNATGVLTAEVGISFAKKFTIVEQEFSFGISPKYQFVETFVYLVQIAEFDGGDFDGNQYTVKDSNFNMDFGVQTSFSNWSLGATLRNAIDKKYTTIDNRVMKISPQLTLGTAYRNNWLTLAVDVDANAVEDPVTQKDVQFSRIGVEFDIYHWAQLRLGFRHDLEGTFGDAASIGLGFSPFGIINIDLAVTASDDDMVGAALQLGLSF